MVEVERMAHTKKFSYTKLYIFSLLEGYDRNISFIFIFHSRYGAVYVHISYSYGRFHKIFMKYGNLRLTRLQRIQTRFGRAFGISHALFIAFKKVEFITTLDSTLEFLPVWYVLHAW